MVVTAMRSEQNGETLIEVVIAIVLLGVLVAAVMATVVTNAEGSQTAQDFATADGVLRSFAEATKAAVRISCTTPTSRYTVTYPPLPANFTITPPSWSSQPCPQYQISSPFASSPSGLSVVTWTVNLPRNLPSQSLNVVVRSSVVLNQ
jgi:prepilin-type N-terminal cleavage/methylation domain-containing protein